MSNIVSVFRKWSKEIPFETAVSDKDTVISYGELDRITDKVAWHLLQKGLKAEDFAAVYVPRTYDILAGALSVLKAGGAYIPIDAEYPDDRILYIIEDADCGFILTVSKLWEKKPVPGFKGEVVFLDEAAADALAADALPDEGKGGLLAAEEAIKADSHAMLLYTSGTTGKPKGVIHTHGSISAMTRSFPVTMPPASEGCRFAVFSGFTFIASALCLLTPVFEGGSSHIISEMLRTDLDGLYRTLKKEKISHLFLPPSLGVLLLERYDIGDVTLLFGGEKMRPVKAIGRPHIMNVYGSTEGVNVFGYKLSGGEEDIPIGHPTPGTEVLLVDENLEQVKCGEIGELLYSSGFMAKGYLHLPEETRKKWISLNGKRYYKTGDRMREDEDGLFRYVGRADDMVKLRGFRVELGEVESCIAKAGGKNFACVVRKVRGADKLCCFYENGQSFDAEGIKAKISKELAHYMMPDLWIAIDALPRNANGKIVRRELPVPDIEQTDYVAPANDVQAMIVKNLEELLKIERIGLNDSFLNMGGDSLSAMSLSSRLRQRGIIISSSDILQTKNVAELCQRASVEYEKIWEDDEWQRLQDSFSARGEKILKVLPLTGDQEMMLMNQLLYPDDPGQVQAHSFLIDCHVRERDVRKALDKVSQRFECLRASVIYKGVSAIQQVVTDRQIPLQVCRAADHDEAQALALAFRQKNSAFSFDLQTEAQLRVACINIDDGKCLILTSVRRLLLDNIRLRWYISELFTELLNDYPDSLEIPTWIELLSMGIGEEDRVLRTKEADGSYLGKLRERQDAPEAPIFTYSDVEGGKKLIFVHTANTGSEAYYNLAKQIESTYSFAVMEQYNIYHPGHEVYGIKNLAKKYLEILREYQPEGPYRLGGWCYGGMLAYEMACLLEQEGEAVESLVLLDSQAAVGEHMKKLSYDNQQTVKREYFETSPLFEDMRVKGMLETLISNYTHLAMDVVDYTPSHYHGRVLYFKPKVVPEGASGAALAYQEAILAKKAGGYENFIDADKLTIVMTPHEHDLMMDSESLDIIVPKLTEFL
ncbi:MAG: AMP-binding protein [Lachnospiraceae bacterium]|nr:AMP-binding protein [Lachnospiraceae bacterium]